MLFKIFLYSFLAGTVLTVLLNLWKKETHWPSAVLRNTVGALFLFSGFVKAVDPLGTAYKIHDYFAAFGLEFLSPAATFFAVFTIVLELVLGVALIIGWRSRITTTLTLLLVVFFTILTGYTAATGKVTDCGCFGDFLKLEPIQSFLKDLVLLVFSLLLMVWSRHITPVLGPVFGRVKMIGATVFSVGFCLYNFIFALPLVDFRPYAVGKDIPSQMVPEVPAVIEYVFVYEDLDTGEEVEFQQDELGALSEGNYDFIERRENVIEEGVPAKIQNFAAYDAGGFDLTDSILTNPDPALWVLTKDPAKSHLPAWDRLNELSAWADEQGLLMFAFAPSLSDDFRHEMQTPFPFYEADETFIKTVVRANPGLVLLQEGEVLAKWHHRHIPEPAAIEALIQAR